MNQFLTLSRYFLVLTLVIGFSFSGVAPSADIMAIQVFSKSLDPDCSEYDLPSPCLLAYSSDIIAGLEHVYEQRNNFNIAAVNLSLGGDLFTDSCDDEPEKASIDLLESAGIAVIVASGNDGSSSSITSPACISSAISVGSTTKYDDISSFSNSAEILDLLAPGTDITSSIPGGGYASFSGTSMATPHVSGTFAVIRSYNANTTVNDLLDALIITGVSIYDYRNGIEKPRISIDSALTYLNPSPVVSITSPTDGAVVNAGENVNFSGIATDVPDGDLSDSIKWSSSMDGDLGTGRNFNLSLCAGSRLITASVTDSGNRTGSDVIALTVNLFGPPPDAVNASLSKPIT